MALIFFRSNVPSVKNKAMLMTVLHPIHKLAKSLYLDPLRTSLAFQRTRHYHNLPSAVRLMTVAQDLVRERIVDLYFVGWNLII